MTVGNQFPLQIVITEGPNKTIKEETELKFLSKIDFYLPMLHDCKKGVHGFKDWTNLGKFNQESDSYKNKSFENIQKLVQNSSQI